MFIFSSESVSIHRVERKQEQVYEWFVHNSSVCVQGGAHISRRAKHTCLNMTVLAVSPKSY